MYYRTRETHRNAYLSDNEYIGNELKSLGAHTSEVEILITNNNEEEVNNNIIRYKNTKQKMKANLKENNQNR